MKLSRSNRLTGCITVSSAWKPSLLLPRMFSNRLTLHGDCFSSLTKAKRRQQRLLAPAKAVENSIVENTKPASHNERCHITAAKSQGSSSIEHRIGYQAGGIVSRIDRVLRQDHSPPRILCVAHGEIGVDVVGRG